MHPGPYSTAHDVSQASASRAIQVASSQPRSSRLHYIVRVTGVGETRLEGKGALQFNMLLLSEPAFSYGVIADGEIPLNSMPLTSAIVLRYVTNRQNLYTGAEIGFVIQPAEFGKPVSVPLRFMLAFDAPAMRSTAGVDSTLGVENNPNRWDGDA